jgi:hypothetical protein
MVMELEFLVLGTFNCINSLSSRLAILYNIVGK